MRQAPDGILDHVEIVVGDVAASRRFYKTALACLDFAEVVDVPGNGEVMGRVGLGIDGYPRLWLRGPGPAGTPLHLAFRAETRQMVDLFHATAIAAGGRDNGLPGIRARYHAAYYAAYVLDPDGNNIEVVCQQSQTVDI